MEFRLNKIDTDIFKKINQSTKIDKIHEQDNISLIKYTKDDGKKDLNHERNDSKSKKYFIVDCVRYKDKTIKIDAEKKEYIYIEKNKGNILDKIK